MDSLGYTINMSECIDISKLKRNTKIIVETESTVLEITVVGPKSLAVSVHGGLKFIRPTKCKISKEIKRGKSIAFVYQDKGKTEKTSTTKVVSASVFSPDNSWSYEAIEKKEQ